ncbi:hypothetical protein AGMMS49545_11760 [Betaproteobacteria bacterium]|nr:hypothetical protein AGMMS49545_11760 [Betaproteobacteria bacterium]GHU48720.1 hypothetical protein AGMMS50289_25590 [Betaproteobacteria bacterium]
MYHFVMGILTLLPFAVLGFITWVLFQTRPLDAVIFIGIWLGIPVVGFFIQYRLDGYEMNRRLREQRRIEQFLTRHNSDLEKREQAQREHP